MLTTTTTIRVSTHTHDLLRELTQRSGISMQSVLEQALEQYRRQQFMESAKVAYAVRRADADAWDDLERERLSTNK
ncbi:MAG: hypothetical protein Fur0021_38860 [Candidatus Promineifilaceae bacterium]